MGSEDADLERVGKDIPGPGEVGVGYQTTGAVGRMKPKGWKRS